MFAGGAVLVSARHADGGGAPFSAARQAFPAPPDFARFPHAPVRPRAQ